MDIFTEARNLVQRYEKGDTFRQHVLARKVLVFGVLALCLLVSIALSLSIVALMEKHAFLALLAIMLVPLILIASLLLQAYLFFAWLELRALAHRSEPMAGTWLAQLRARLGKAPPVPWELVGVVLGVPFLLLALASWKMAALVLVAAILTPILYAQLDSP